MINVRSLLQGDRFGPGHGLVESAALGLDVGPDPCRARTCRLSHRVDDLPRLVEPAALLEQACQHPWHSGVRGPLLHRFLEVDNRGVRVPPDPGDLREALLDLKPTRPVVLRFNEIVAGLFEVIPILCRERRGDLVCAELHPPRDLHLQNQDHRQGDPGLGRGSARQIADLLGIGGELCHVLLVDCDLEKGGVGPDLRRLPLEDDACDPLGLRDVVLLDSDRHDSEENKDSVFGGDLLAGGLDGRQTCLSLFSPQAGSGTGFSGEHPGILTNQRAHAHERIPGSADLRVGDEQGHQLGSDLGVVRSRLKGPGCDLDRGRTVTAALHDTRLNRRELGIPDVGRRAQDFNELIDLLPVAFRFGATHLILDQEVEQGSPEQLHARQIFRRLEGRQRLELRQGFVVPPCLAVGRRQRDAGLVRVWIGGEYAPARLEKLV